jgi:hypothetical protein
LRNRSKAKEEAMFTGTTMTRVIGTAVLALSAAALLVPAASGKPTPRIYEQPNRLGSQLDRLQPVSDQATVAVPPDAFERASQGGAAASSDDGGAVDWGLVAALCAIAAVCVGLAGATFLVERQHGRTAHT